jgi:hypothetical protein
MHGLQRGLQPYHLELEIGGYYSQWEEPYGVRKSPKPLLQIRAFADVIGSFFVLPSRGISEYQIENRRLIHSVLWLLVIHDPLVASSEVCNLTI